MSGMNTYLAEAYGTTQPLETGENAEKVAQAELFAKLAAEQNIDLSTLDDKAITALWNATFSAEASTKTAAATTTTPAAPAAASADEEKLAQAAQAEWVQTKEAQAKMVEADFLGRQMAHAYVHELKKIAQAGGLNFVVPPTETKTAGMPPQLAAALGKGGGDEKKEEKKDDKGDEKKDDKKDEKKEAAAKAPPAPQQKVASNLTRLGALKAIEKAASVNLDRDEAARKVAAVLELGIFDESKSKIAAATDFNDAVEIRALELLEVAGYPVTWS